MNERRPQHRIIERRWIVYWVEPGEQPTSEELKGRTGTYHQGKNRPGLWAKLHCPEGMKPLIVEQH